MKLTASFTGIEELQARFRVLADLAPKAASKELKIALNEILSDAKIAIQTGPKTGIIYGAEKDIIKVKLGGKGSGAAAKRIHQASAPGEAPASDTRNLVDSGRVVIDGDGMSGYVLFNCDYAARLEFGDTDKKPGFSFIEARPYLFPALQKQIPLFIAGLKTALREATRR